MRFFHHHVCELMKEKAHTVYDDRMMSNETQIE